MKKLLIILSLALLMSIIVANTLTVGDYNKCVNYCYKAYAGNDEAIKACISRCK